MPDDQRWDDRLELRELTYRYARALDRRDFAAAEALFTPDARLAGPGFDRRGVADVVEMLKQVVPFESTLHAVHNHLVEVEGDAAAGETYCVASHVYERNGVKRKLDWGIRYQDRYVRVDGAWRFAERELHVDWQQDLPLRLD